MSETEGRINQRIDREVSRMEKQISDVENRRREDTAALHGKVGDIEKHAASMEASVNISAEAAKEIRKAVQSMTGSVAEQKTDLTLLKDSQKKRDRLTTTAATTGVGAFVLWVWSIIRGQG